MPKRIGFCVTGAVLIVMGYVTTYIYPDNPVSEWTVYDTLLSLLPVGYYFAWQGSYWWVKEKGRSGWWSLFGLLAPFSYPILQHLGEYHSANAIKRAYEVLGGQDSGPNASANLLGVKHCVKCEERLTAEMDYCPKCGYKSEPRVV